MSKLQSPVTAILFTLPTTTEINASSARFLGAVKKPRKPSRVRQISTLSS
jgi:hypothetical protein